MSSPAMRVKIRWLYLPWTFASVVFFTYLLLWRAGASEMKKAVNDWAQDQRAAGAVVSYDALKSDGFPFFLRVHVEQPEIEYADQLRWRTDRLTIDALPYNLNRLIFSTRSEQQVRVANGSEWRIETSDFQVSLANDKDRKWKLAANVADASAQRSDGVTANLRRLVFDISPTVADPSIVTLSLDAQSMQIKLRDREFALDALQTVMAASQAPHLVDTQNWRDSGGVLLINGLIATVDDASLSLTGELSADQQLFPAGALHTEIKSPATFVALLAAAGALDKNDVETLSSTLTLAAIAGGGKLTAPMILKDGLVQIAGVTVAAMDSND